jgi:hypothetical protein
MSLFFSLVVTVLMQVHLDAPQANLNAWGAGQEQDLYQSCFALIKTFNLMICLDI